MSIDTFIEIGTNHKVCQDYIISGYEPVPFIILSDGCSTANNSDMGSRILCYLAKQYLRYNADSLRDIDYWKLGQWIIHNAEQTARQLGLSISCLTATLIVSYQIDGMLRVMIYGDGSFVKVYTQAIDMYTVEFERNAPFYLVYLIDDYRFGLYDAVKPMKSLIVKHSNGETEVEKYAYDYPIDLKFQNTNIPVTLITSDGIDSFMLGTTPFKGIDIIPNIANFKTLKGEFLKRRMNKQMKCFGKDGVAHFDDLSVGAYLGKQEEK